MLWKPPSSAGARVSETGCSSDPQASRMMALGFQVSISLPSTSLYTIQCVIEASRPCASLIGHSVRIILDPLKVVKK